MHRRILLAAAALSALSAPALAQRGPTLTLYDGPDFQGDSRTFLSADGNLQGVRFNDRAVSLIAEGRWQVCMDADFRSACRVYEGRIPNLGDLAVRISSVRPVDGLDGGWGPGYGGGWGGRVQGVAFFSDRGFRGEQRQIDREVQDFRDIGFNDRAQSLAVRRGTSWEICENAAYGGRCTVVDRDVPDLSVLGLNLRISSVRPAGWGGGPGYGGPGYGGWDPGWGGSLDRPSATGRNAAFFPRPTWNGRAITLGGGNPDRVADDVCRRAGWSRAAFYSAQTGALEDLLCVR